MKYAILDVETTTFLKGAPYSARNRLCYVGIRIAGVDQLFDIEYSDGPYGPKLADIHTLLSGVDVVVGFNLKFDLGWLRRYGINYTGKVWDCQLCEFLGENQRTPYPGLAETLRKYALGTKSQIIEETYWSKGIDTPDIPRFDLEDYLRRDLEVTDELYRWQVEHFDRSKLNLFRVQCEDLLVLLDMEHNGMVFRLERLRERSCELADELQELQSALSKYSLGWSHFNWDSGDHLNALLYGGTISVEVGTPAEQVLKSGPRRGETVIRNRWETVTQTYPRLYEPLPRSELKKENTWSTDEATLKQLKGPKQLIRLLLKRAELEKLKSTYIDGIPKIIEKYDWQDGIVHGTFNQCRVITGRLSSEKPNLQNFPEELNQYITTRF